MDSSGKKHKKGRSAGLAADGPCIKSSLKVGGSSTPKHRDSRGGGSMSLSGMNPQFDVDDSQHSSLFAQHVRKSKKRDQKRKKDNKHHCKDTKRGKELKREEDSDRETSMDISTASDKSMSDGSYTLSPDQQTSQEHKYQPKTRNYLDKQAFKKLLNYLLKMLGKQDRRKVFTWPVTDKIAPGYSSIIKNPMDFSTMKLKIENDTYISLSELTEDFELMCNNAMTYNQPGTIYYNAAERLLQDGLEILAPEIIKSLLPLIPSIPFLTEEHLGSPLFGANESGDVCNSDDDTYYLGPTKRVRYVAPHPNNRPGAFTDDWITKEVLSQARLAAGESAHRLATKKPNSKMGFCRQKPDGSTSLAILTPCSGVLPGTKEMPISLGALSGKLTQWSTQVHSFKEDRSFLRSTKALGYGPFCSFAPAHDSRFGNLTSEEAEVIGSTYGEEADAASAIKFAMGCDYEMHMVDEILDTITRGEHRKTVNLIEERKLIEDEEIRLQDELGTQSEVEWQTQTTPAVSLESLQTLGDIDTKFLDDFYQQQSVPNAMKLQETAELIGDLQKVQNERLSQPPLQFPPYVPQATEVELNLASKITDNLTEMAKQVTPGDLASPEAIRKVMGIDINSATYVPAPSRHDV